MSILKNITILFSIFLMCLVGCQTLRSEETGQEVNQMESKYFEIAQKKIIELGMDMNNLQCRDKTAEWKDFLQKKGKKGELDNLSQKLSDIDFVAIYCGPKDLDVLGGDINVFIDRATDEIADVLRGQ